jgi:uncharacterized protein (DUF362 family)
MKIFTTLLLALIFCSISVKATNPDIVSVHGKDAFAMTHTAVETLGGMQRFVKPGQRVGILVNSGFRDRGAYVDPDVVIAVLKMVYDAGASDVVFLQHVLPEYWKRSSLEPQYHELIARARTIEANHFPSVYNEQFFVKVPHVEGAVEQGELEIVKEFLEVDVFINIPIAKNHTLTTLTNAMKNLMGVNTRTSNVTFHLNGPARNDPGYLAQRIADLNLLRKADLIVSDVTYVLVTNGPNGPGENIEPGRVVAGTDPVAMDAFCAQLAGFFVEDVLTIQKGFELGLGQKDLSFLKIVEVTQEQTGGL